MRIAYTTQPCIPMISCAVMFVSQQLRLKAGLSTISARRFLTTDILGCTFRTVFVTLMGIYGMHPPVWFWVLAILGFLPFPLAGQSIRR
jgi:membrane protein DedA with SNARE-associated domain